MTPTVSIYIVLRFKKKNLQISQMLNNLKQHCVLLKFMFFNQNDILIDFIGCDLRDKRLVNIRRFRCSVRWHIFYIKPRYLTS